MSLTKQPQPIRTLFFLKMLMFCPLVRPSLSDKFVLISLKKRAIGIILMEAGIF